MVGMPPSSAIASTWLIIDHLINCQQINLSKEGGNFSDYPLIYSGLVDRLLDDVGGGLFLNCRVAPELTRDDLVSHLKRKKLYRQKPQTQKELKFRLGLAFNETGKYLDRWESYNDLFTEWNLILRYDASLQRSHIPQ